jgi:monoamine oxidase
VFGQEYAAETRDIGAKYVEEVINFNGAEHIFPGGYKQIIEVLAKDVNIQYSQVVNYIDYSGTGVSVRTKSGKVYEGDKVIVTVPLALLQSGAITFNPVLSSSKTSAINRIGVGLMDKLWLEFDEAFWKDDEETDWICFVSDKPGVWVETLNVDKYLNIPLLIMFNIGDVAEEYSELSDEDYLATAMATIRKWYPDAPDYIRYSRSNWSKDEFALGSYSYIKAGASFSDCDYYTEFDSTDGKVFFAGEATMCDMMGAAHAAYISGVDAANFAVKGHDYDQKTFEDRYSREYESSDSEGMVVGFIASLALLFI